MNKEEKSVGRTSMDSYVSENIDCTDGMYSYDLTALIKAPSTGARTFSRENIVTKVRRCIDAIRLRVPSIVNNVGNHDNLTYEISFTAYRTRELFINISVVAKNDEIYKNTNEFKACVEQYLLSQKQNIINSLTHALDNTGLSILWGLDVNVNGYNADHVRLVINDDNKLGLDTEYNQSLGSSQMPVMGGGITMIPGDPILTAAIYSALRLQEPVSPVRHGDRRRRLSESIESNGDDKHRRI